MVFSSWTAGYLCGSLRSPSTGHSGLFSLISLDNSLQVAAVAFSTLSLRVGLKRVCSSAWLLCAPHSDSSLLLLLRPLPVWLSSLLY